MTVPSLNYFSKYRKSGMCYSHSTFTFCQVILALKYFSIQRREKCLMTVVFFVGLEISDKMALSN